MQTFPIGICRKSQTDRIRFAFFASLSCVSISENGGRNFKKRNPKVFLKKLHFMWENHFVEITI